VRYPPNHYGKPYEFLVSDTIGFIRDLPPNLIEAFRSTLEDSVESDILLHVIDASDPTIHDKIRIVDEILDQIGATQTRIYVFNQIDQIDDQTLNDILSHYTDQQTITLSALEKQGTEELKELIYKIIYNI
jgi:GTP-binding protein HflX